MESQNYHSQKSFGIKRIIKSFENSFNGLREAYTTEQSLLIHLTVSIIAIILCIVLKATKLEWIIMIFMLSTILTVELLNTAIENVVDLVTTEYHPLAKVAKDTGSAAEFVIVMTSILISLSIFIPKIIALF